MKRLFFCGLFLLTALSFSIAQNNNCTPLFSGLAEHDVHECITKEFEKLEIYSSDKKSGFVSLEKTGEYQKLTYTFKGSFEKRPSGLQIFQNYSNAISNAGGEVLYKDDARGLSGKLKKDGNTFWIKVSTDGSGFYWVETVREGSMRQDVVFTSGEIKKMISEEGKVVFYGIYFDTDKAILQPESAPVLKEIAAFLKSNPGINIFVVGHTDNTGDYKRNLALSKERAMAVLTELSSKYQVEKQQLIAEGVGSLAPVATNTTNEGKARNRRVEIVVR